MDAFLGLGALALFLAVFAAFVGGIGYWILGPMHRATYKTKRATQFFVSDFFWLVAQLQVALATVVLLKVPYGTFTWVLLAGASWVSVIAMWWASITALTRARVRSPLRRATFVLFVVPVATIGVVGAFFSNVVLCAAAAATLFADRADTNLPWLLVLNIPAAGLFYGCRQLTFWILAGSETPPDESQR